MQQEDVTAGATDTEALIGARFDDPDVQATLARLDPRAEVEDSDGKINWISRPSGMALSIDARTSRITVVFIYPEGVQQYRGFKGKLPGGISVDLGREQVRERLGTPDKSGPSHDFWERGAYNVSVQYTPAGAIKKLGLMS